MRHERIRNAAGHQPGNMLSAVQFGRSMIVLMSVSAIVIQAF
jgi:hypothetical protein